MTLDEALLELSLPGGSTAADARKAYLRLLKVRKPDADPEGFMRLREAYELTSVLLPILSQGVAFAAPSLPIAPAVIEPSNEPFEAPDEAFDETFDFSNDATDETFDVAASGPPQLVFPGDWLDVHGSSPAAAASSMASALREAAKHPDHVAPWPGQALDLLARAYERSDLEAAKDLMDALDEYLSAAGGEARLLHGFATLSWVLLRELWEVRDSMPAEVREALARSIRERKPESASDTLAHFRNKKSRAAYACARTLRARAPSLGAWVGEALPEKKPFWKSKRAEGDPRVSRWWLLWISLIAVPRIFSTLSDFGNHSAPPHHPTPPFATLSETTPDFHGRVEAIALLAEKHARRDVANLTRSTGDALEQGDCASASILMTLLREERGRFNSTEHAALEKMESQLDLSVQRSCKLPPPQWRAR